MNARFKLLIGAAVGLLLASGLCGVDHFLWSSKDQEFGGPASFLGFIIFIVSVLLLLGTLLSFAVTGITDLFKGRR
jgi:hypothetical protein